MESTKIFNTMAEAVVHSIQYKTVAYYVDECKRYLFVNGQLLVITLPDGTKEKYTIIC